MKVFAADLDTDSEKASTDENSDAIPQAALSCLSAIKSDEAVLLMHFIDTVFPLQYPMYKPNVLEGGRGWLLSLLLSTKPLYHASLALSAYHRGTILLAASRRGCSAISAVEQERHLAICLSEFQQAIKDVGHWVSNTCPSNSLGLMACVIQLIFFEVRHPIKFIQNVLLNRWTALCGPWRRMANTFPSMHRYILQGLLGSSNGAWSSRVTGHTL
jgi:hypothetical protein